MTLGYVDFEFDLPGALLARLVDVLDEMEAAPLLESFISGIPEEQGVYQLFHDGHLAYIGKTDAEAGLRKRLSRHQNKVQHRIGLDPEQVLFKAVRIYVFTAIDLETQLLRHYGGEKAVPWNGSGFGSNDPGRQRDTSEYKETHFDAIFPIDIDRELDLDITKMKTAAEAFMALKAELPYTFRFQTTTSRSRQPHPDLLETQVSIPATMRASAKNIIEQVVDQLPFGWKATKLPSHVILYKNDDRSFPFGTEIAHSPA